MNYTNIIILSRLHSIRVINTISVENKKGEMKMKNTIIFLASMMMVKTAFAVDNNLNSVDNPPVCAIQKVNTCAHTGTSEEDQTLVFTLVEKAKLAQIVQFQGADLYGSHFLTIQSKQGGFHILQTTYTLSDQSTLKISEETLIGRGGVSRGGDPLPGHNIKIINALLTQNGKEYDFYCN